jgi:hypothetical protein
VEGDSKRRSRKRRRKRRRSFESSLSARESLEARARPWPSESASP